MEAIWQPRNTLGLIFWLGSMQNRVPGVQNLFRAGGMERHPTRKANSVVGPLRMLPPTPQICGLAPIPRRSEAYCFEYRILMSGNRRVRDQKGPGTWFPVKFAKWRIERIPRTVDPNMFLIHYPQIDYCGSNELFRSSWGDS